MKITKWFYFILLFTSLIWMQSVFPGDISSAESGFLVRIAIDVLNLFNITIESDVLHHIIRKIAHFMEFFILGLLWLAFVLSQEKLENKYLFLMSIAVVLTAATDEIIQLFSIDRGPSITDFFIDITGGLIVLVVYMLFKLLYNRNVEKI
ncbi:VanZ family protein [Mycoplasmatota bacterium]|nr:VanZ family protein [Mycoplasmatota bacterium]